MPLPIQTDYAPIDPRPIHGKNWESILKLGTDKIEGLNWQLGCGTLLGAVREPDHYIHHEIDLDIDIMIDNLDDCQKVEELHHRLLSDGFIILRTQTLQLDRNLYMSAAFLHQKTNIIFDICYLYGLWTEDFLHFGTKGIVIRPKYTLKSKNIQIGENFYNIPERAEDYLAGRYGDDWQTPRKYKKDWYKELHGYFIPLSNEI